jgi:ribosomal protein S18 acetylase RimI-like enzyme
VTTIRVAVPNDAREIAEVHVASWRWAYRSQLQDDYLDRLSVEEREAQWASGLAEMKSDAGVIVAEEGGRIVGFVEYGPTQDDDADDSTGEILAIYLLEGAIGRGTGHRLLTEALGGLREGGFRRASLWVLESNDAARRFYEKVGWAWDGTTSTHDFECANMPIVRYAVDL